MKHQCVMRLEEFYLTRNKLYLVLELMKGGSLLDLILERGGLNEAEAKIVFRQVRLQSDSLCRAVSNARSLSCGPVHVMITHARASDCLQLLVFLFPFSSLSKTLAALITGLRHVGNRCLVGCNTFTIKTSSIAT